MTTPTTRKKAKYTKLDSNPECYNLPVWHYTIEEEFWDMIYFDEI